MSDEHSAQLDGALRYEQAPPSTMSYAPVPQPLKNYFHAESTRERGAYANGMMAQRHGLYDGTPHSSVLYEPLAGDHGPALRPGTVHSGDANKNSASEKKWKTIGTIVAIVVLLALGIALLFIFMRENGDEKDSLATVAGAESLQSNVTGASVADQGYYDFDAPRGGNAIDVKDTPYVGPGPESYFYMPTPLQTPERSGTPIEGTPIDDFDTSAPPPAPYQREPNEAASRRALERSNKPPPASWFGADAPTRGASSEAMALDGELNNQQAIDNIYGAGRANSVLGGQSRAPFAQVNDDAARQIGWAEIGDNGAPERGDAGAMMDANRIAGGSARSMSELYEANLGARSEYRDGSSASTIVTPDQAAQQTVGHNPDRSAQFDEGRHRAKQITAESAAAIGSIYAKKRQAAAGLSAAAAAKQRDSNDSNYEFFDEYSQQPAQ